VSIVSSLRSAGLNARVALPDVKELIVSNEIGVEGIYKYHVPIGLGLMALEASEDELNIFEHLYNPAAKEEKKHWLYSPKVTCVIAAVMLVLSAVVYCSVDMKSPKAIEKRLKASLSDTNMNLLIQRQKLIKMVAQQRPDLLNLLGERGIKLESFHFKKGQPVTITGQASTNDQFYKFEESLENRKNIKIVNTNPSIDAKSKKVKFTITFHYKSFTK
jgi:hypothetical protein